MSPRAAWRLERFGFTAYDYVAGKADWLAAGLPSVRSTPSDRRALDAADRAPPTCTAETVLDASPTRSVVVVNEHGIVVGRIRPGTPTGAVAEDVMELGPTTVRANEPLDDLVGRMRRHRVDEVVVSTPEGRLLGVVRLP